MSTRRKTRYLWTSINIGAGVLIGVALVIRFCWFEEVNPALSLIWSMAFLVVGCLLGFIFSVPKIISGDAPLNNLVTTANATYVKRIEENTNLTQISDWLTKLLIGAGLVQIEEAPGYILKVARTMAMGLRPELAPLATVDEFTTLCAAIILFFVIWGFIAGYLVMRLILSEQFANIED